MAQRGCEILLHRSASYDLYKDKACRRGFLHPTTFPLFLQSLFRSPARRRSQNSLSSPVSSPPVSWTTGLASLRSGRHSLSRRIRLGRKLSIPSVASPRPTKHLASTPSSPGKTCLAQCRRCLQPTHMVHPKMWSLVLSEMEGRGTHLQLAISTIM